MKHLLLTTLSACFLTIVFCSCGKKETAGIMTNTAGKEAKNETSNYKIHCSGNCATNEKCALEGIIDGNGTYVQCHCNSCEMEVELSATKDGNIIKEETNILPGGQTAVHFWQAFLDHMTAAYPGQAYSITSVEIWDDTEGQDNYVVTYTYQVHGEATATITFLWNRAAKTTQKVDCKGTCDCRERYYPATGAIECTCTDNCSMTVTKLAADAWD